MSVCKCWKAFLDFTVSNQWNIKSIKKNLKIYVCCVWINYWQLKNSQKGKLADVCKKKLQSRFWLSLVFINEEIVNITCWFVFPACAPPTRLFALYSENVIRTYIHSHSLGGSHNTSLKAENLPDFWNQMKFANCNGGTTSGPSSEARKTILTSSTSGYIIVRWGRLYCITSLEMFQ